MKKIIISILLFLLYDYSNNIKSQVISAGVNHSIFLCTNQTAMGVGKNTDGELGVGMASAQAFPNAVPVINLADVKSVAAGNGYSIFLKTDGTVWSVGYNGYGQLGDGTLIDKSTPTQISSLSNIISIACGNTHALFLKNDGTVWSVGRNNFGQLGNGTTFDSSTPVQVIGLTNVIAISAGRSFSLFLKDNGVVWGVGINNQGQIGDATFTNRTTPVQSVGLTNISSISCGAYHSLFLRNDGTVWATGNNLSYQQSNSTPDSGRNTPGQISLLSSIKEIAAGYDYSLFLKNDGTLRVVGGNSFGQLGDGTTTNRSQINSLSLTNILAISAGEFHSLFLQNDGEVLSVGKNVNGQLGDGTTTQRTAPIQVSNLCHISQSSLYNTQGVSGKIYHDANEDCLLSSLENGLANRTLIINPGDIVVQTDINGSWYIDSLGIGTYNISVDSTENWKPTCAITQTFTVTDSESLTYGPNFGLYIQDSCTQPNVSIFMPVMRRGFQNQKVYIQACNNYLTTRDLIGAYTEIQLDTFLLFENASISFEDLGSNKYRFQHGDLNPGECVNYHINTKVKLSSEVGQTLCLEASLYPVEDCVLDTLAAENPLDFVPCDLPWDKSSLSIKSFCVNDSIVFNVNNTADLGQGDMDCYSPVRLFIDGQYILLDSLKLMGGESINYSFSGDGRTWRMEVDQHPLHPGKSFPNTSIEKCGSTSNWTHNLVNILPMDDADPIIDIYCGIVTASLDPNDKTGFPLGIGSNHVIEPNQKIEYKIRFQNTGTDTAFTVVIRDTLDTDLDILSIQSGVSSHPYTFKLYGPRVLEWTFDNILLPDSTTNEQASNGFVTFEVNQSKDLADNTEINNTVGIYFDFNEPVITNTTSHIIQRNLNIPSYSYRKNLVLESCSQYLLNGVTYVKSGEYYQIVEGGANNDTLLIIDLTLNQNSQLNISEIACYSYIAPDGQVYNSSGLKTAIVPNSVGCDSTININLTILNPSTKVDSHLACASFTWIDGNTYTSSNNSAIYTISGAAANGCDSIYYLDLTILSPQNPTINISSSEIDNLFCSGTSVNFTSSATNQGSNPIYNWKINGTTVSSGSSFSTTSLQDNDVVSCELISSETCVTQSSVSSNSFTFNVDPIPTISLGSVNNTSTCGNSDGSITINGTGSGTLTWSGQATGSQVVTLPYTLTNLSAGNYNLIFDNGCPSSSILATVANPSLPPTPTISNSGSLTFCEGGTVTLTSSIGTNITWSTGETTPSISVSSSGSYYVTNTVNACSSVSATKVVTVNPNPPTATISASGNTTICSGGSVTLTSDLASGNVWSNGASTQSIIVNSTGNYSVTTTLGSCTKTSNSIAIVVNPSPTIALGSVTPTGSCGGSDGTIQINGSGSGTISWTGTTSGTQNVILPILLQNFGVGSYNVTYANANGCNSNTVSATVSSPASPSTPSISAAGVTTFCQGGSVVLNSSATTGNVWSNGSTSQSITVNQSGTYTTVVSSAPGCDEISNEIIVTVIPTPVTPVITASGATTFCQGGSVVLSSSATSGNSWTGGGTAQDITVNSSGTYVVNVTENGCVSANSAPIVVTVNPIPAAPFLSASGPTTFCAGESVTLSSDVTSGIVWSPNGETSASITTSDAGTYFVTVLVNGCSNTSSAVTTSVNPVPTPSIASIADVCDTADVIVLNQGSPVGGVYTVNGTTATSFTPNAGNVGVNTIEYSLTQNNCTGTASTSITVIDCSTGVGLTETTLTFKLFPNPTTGIIEISGIPSEDITSIKVYDQVGKLILTDKQNNKINLTSFARGIYTVHIKTSRCEAQHKIELIK